jgi:uncharacterized membrane protein HdeD (DUF308 family)
VSKRMEAALQQGLPWRKGIPWWLVLVEGALIIALGLYLYFQPDSARSTIRGLIGAFLIFNSVIGIAAGLRETTRNLPMSPYRLIRGGVGLLVGLIVVLQPIFTYIDADATRTILAVGLTLWGLIGLYGAFATHDEGGFRWNTVILSGLSIALAIMLFSSGDTANSLLEPIGIIAIVVGFVLIAYSYALYRNSQSRTGLPNPEAALP